MALAAACLALLALCPQSGGDDNRQGGSVRRAMIPSAAHTHLPRVCADAERGAAVAAARTGRTTASSCFCTAHFFPPTVWPRKLLQLRLRGGRVGGSESEESLQELEPDWLVDMKDKQDRGEAPLVEEDSSWAKPDIFDKMRAGGKINEGGLNFKALKSQRKPDLRAGSLPMGNSAPLGHDDLGEDSNAPDAEGSVPMEEQEEAAYVEHNGQRMPLVGNAGTDVEFLRKLSQAWKVQGHTMKVVVPPHLQAELDKPVSASFLHRTVCVSLLLSGMIVDITHSNA